MAGAARSAVDAEAALEEGTASEGAAWLGSGVYPAMRCFCTEGAESVAGGSAAWAGSLIWLAAGAADSTG
ncbi:hypothetical protein, partial [Pseudomonas aeruginosa]|uniref:hypothetical protein n=1 Tax=Pseudomonas aeruginosa TaxID=287 RepID=UPI00397BE549